MKDVVLVAAIVIAFALLATAHVAIVFGLARRGPRWRAVAALVALPLAPYWAWSERMHVRAVVWAAGLVAYAVASIIARL